jgi:tetratricopeptide (TPR) repeat protein
MRIQPGWLLIPLMIGCGTQSLPTTQTQTLPDSPIIAEALAAAKGGDEERGLQLLTAEIAAHPDDARLYGARATLHHHAGRNRQALEDLDRAISLTPDDPQLLNNRGFIRLSLERYDDALADLDRAVELKQDMASACNNRGLLSLALGNSQDAMAWFTRALEADGDYIDAWNNRGFAAMQLGRIEEAYADLNQALRLSPKYVNALHNRGLVRAKAGELEEAVLDFTAAMILDPENPRYYEQRGATYQLLGKKEEARQDRHKHGWLVELQKLHQAVKDQPRSAAAWTNRANHYRNHGDEEQANRDLKEALRIDPEFSGAKLLAAKIELAQAHWEQVVQLTADILDSDDGQAAASVRGDALLALGRYDEALKCFVAARRFDSSVAEVYFRQSQELSAAGDADAAKSRLEQALELDPEVERRLR